MVMPESNQPQNEPAHEPTKGAFEDLKTVRPTLAPSKILIISVPGSGSSSLCQTLGSYFNCAIANEPFNPLNASKPVMPEERIVGEIAIAEPNPAFFDYFSGLEEYFSYLDELRTNFDKTILLSRELTDDSEQSSASIQERERALSARNPDMDLEQITSIGQESSSNPPSTRDPATRQELLASVETLATYAKRSQIPLVMCEDLYSKDIQRFSKALETLGLPVDPSALGELFDPSRCHRQT